MPEWKQLTDYSERLDCKLAVLLVERTNNFAKFNFYIYTGKGDGVEIIYKLKDYFPGSSQMKDAQRFLISQYRAILEKDIEFISDKRGKSDGVF
jgi:hypothetical protein